MKGLDPAAVLIVTRPQPEADRLCEALRARGREALAFPVMSIEPADDAGLVARTMSRLDDYRLVVFVSPNAIRAALSFRDAPWPADVVIGVMGPGSVSTLASLGLRAPDVRIVAPAPGAQDAGGDRFDSESLFAALDDTLGLSTGFAGRALILRGNGGRAWFADRLRQLGIAVDEVEAYRRRATSPDADGTPALRRLFVDRLPTAFVVTSSEAIGLLVERVERSLEGVAAAAEVLEWLRGRPLLVPHRRIADHAVRAGFAHVALCGPGDAGILAAIE